MLKKLKTNLKSLFSKKLPILLLLGFFGFSGLVLSLPKKASAACTGVTSPFICDQSTINLSFSSNQVRIGDKITFSITVNNNTGLENLLGNKLQDQRTVQVLTGTKIVQSKALPVSPNATIDLSPVTIGAPWFTQPNKYKIRASISLGCTNDVSLQCISLYGPELDLTVLEANKTGPATLTIDQTDKSAMPGSDSVSVRFNFNYLPGGTGKTPSKFLYYCDYKENQTNGPMSLSVGSNSFSCAYTGSVRDYSVLVQAIDSSNPPVVIASASSKVQITGNERNEGESIVGANANDGLLGLLVKIVNFLIGILQEIIFGIFYLLIAPIMQAVLSIRTYTDTFAAVIYPGWEIIRNLCNIIFIIALIAIAMGTLLRVEKYQYKHLLVQLILAALLINFSLVIGQAILGVADTLQNQFLPNSTEVIRALAKDLMVGYRSVVWNLDFSKYGYISSFAQPLFFLALSLGSFCVFLAIAAFLVIRMAMLWILLMISPIAYAAGVLPQTEHYRTEWWTTFLKYAFFTPIMAFFLNMTAIIANTYQNNQLFTQFGLKDSDFGGSGLANFIFRIGSNLILLVFLMVALIVAEKFSIYGAGAITKIAKGGIMAPFAGAGWGIQRGLGYVGRKWNEMTADMVHGRKMTKGQRVKFALLNPVAAVKGWQKHSEELKHAAQAEAEAVGLMAVEQTLSPGKAFNRKAIAERAHDAEFLKNYSDLTREEGVDTAYDAATMKKDMNGKAARRAVYQANMKEGWVDDIVQEADENGRGKELIAQMRALKSKYKITDADFEEVNEYEWDTEINPTTGKKRYKRDSDGKKIAKKDAAGNEIVIGTKRRLKYDAKTRRAMQLAMFGEKIHYETDENGVEREIVEFEDQAAAKLVADEGEVLGKSTKHAEYMADQVYDAKSHHGQGGYRLYELEFATQVQDEMGTHDVVNGRAVSGKYQGQLITVNHEGAVHSRREVAKWQSREQAGIAHHALMDISNGKLDKEMFQVVSKALSENPGFAQERTANMLLTGTDDPAKLRSIIDEYWKTGKLNVDDASKKRIADMASVSPEALKAVLARFVNKAKGNEPDMIAKNPADGPSRGLVIEGYEQNPGVYTSLNLNNLLIKKP